MIILQKSSNGKLIVEEYKGKILYTVAEAMNFTPKIITPTDGLFCGHVFKNGTATGLVGDIVHRRAEVGLVNLLVNKDRFHAVDVTILYHTGCFTWLV